MSKFSLVSCSLRPFCPVSIYPSTFASSHQIPACLLTISSSYSVAPSKLETPSDGLARPGRKGARGGHSQCRSHPSQRRKEAPVGFYEGTTKHPCLVHNEHVCHEASMTYFMYGRPRGIIMYICPILGCNNVLHVIFDDVDELHNSTNLILIHRSLRVSAIDVSFH